MVHALSDRDCFRCGQGNPDRSNYCNRCGQDLRQDPRTPRAQDPRAQDLHVAAELDWNRSAQGHSRAYARSLTYPAS